MLGGGYCAKGIFYDQKGLLSDIMAQVLGLHFLSLLTTAAARTGSDLKVALASLALGVHTGEGRPPFLPLSVLAALVEQLEARARHGRFVFALADVFNFDNFPAVAAFLASAGNLRQAHQLLAWVPELVHPALRFEVVEQARETCLCPQVVADVPRLRDHPLLTELMTAAAVHLGRLMAPGLPVVRGVEFRHAPLAEVAVYEAWFACPVRFHADRNALLGDSRLIDGPLPGSLPQAHASAEEAIRVHLLGDGLAPPLAVQAEALLRQRPVLLGEGVEALAALLRLHPRALQRRLREAGTSYSALVARLRHEQACAMLRDDALDIESIALKLGFSERRSFTLAFRQWQGCAPSDYRRAARAG